MILKLDSNYFLDDIFLILNVEYYCDFYNFELIVFLDFFLGEKFGNYLFLLVS